mmetsp:Transcript_31300/g.48538  ORF Transcript_31300/g.48538 Transcript_31300/m.48538 type:complete len:221 (-) Transcript_31300:1593-2255(-)
MRPTLFATFSICASSSIGILGAAEALASSSAGGLVSAALSGDSISISIGVGSGCICFGLDGFLMTVIPGESSPSSGDNKPFGSVAAVEGTEGPSSSSSGLFLTGVIISISFGSSSGLLSVDSESSVGGLTGVTLDVSGGTETGVGDGLSFGSTAGSCGGSGIGLGSSSFDAAGSVAGADDDDSSTSASFSVGLFDGLLLFAFSNISSVSTNSSSSGSSSS